MFCESVTALVLEPGHSVVSGGRGQDVEVMVLVEVNRKNRLGIVRTADVLGLVSAIAIIEMKKYFVFTISIHILFYKAVFKSLLLKEYMVFTLLLNVIEGAS